MFTKKAFGLCGLLVFGIGTTAAFLNNSIYIILWFPMLVLSLKYLYFEDE